MINLTTQDLFGWVENKKEKKEIEKNREKNIDRNS